MKRTPLERRTPLVRRTRLRPVSNRRQRQARQRSAFVAEQLAKRPDCEVGRMIGAYRIDTYGAQYGGRLIREFYPCAGRSVDIHEPLTRARGGSILDVANTVAVCRGCHDWIHDHPQGATALGLLKGSRR